MYHRNYIVNPHWTSIINNNTLIEAYGSISVYRILGTNPNNDGSPAYIDQATGIVSGGDSRPPGDNRRNRHQFKADLSHFRENWLGGNHSLKTGIKIERTPIYENRFLNGARGANELAGCTDACISQIPDTEHELFNRAPFRVQLYNSPTFTRYNTKKLDAYVEDQWVLADRLTMNLGVRVDHTSGNLEASSVGGGRWDSKTEFPQVDGIVKLTGVAPRFGAVWDVAGDHKTTIKGSAGQFYSEFGASLLQLVQPTALGFREYTWVDRNNDLIYQPGEETQLFQDTRPNPAFLGRVDPDLKSQHTNVYTVGLERQVRQVWGIAVTGIFKRDRDIFGQVNLAVPLSAYNPIVVTNPLDAQPLQIFTLRPEFVGVRNQILLTNPGTRPGDPVPLRRQYRGMEVVLRKRMQDNWQMQTSYVYGRGKGNASNQVSGSNVFDYTNPNALVNTYGDLPLGPRHQFKLNGTYLAPFALAFSGSLDVQSGIPWTEGYGLISSLTGGARTVRFLRTAFPQILSGTFIDVAGEPAGTHKFDPVVRLDLRGEKRFNVGLGHFSVVADVFNVFNANTVISLKSLRTDNANFGLPATIVTPRQLRIGAKWDF
jgi:outer membrane receptor protein involved in Fe transport